MPRSFHSPMFRPTTDDEVLRAGALCRRRYPDGPASVPDGKAVHGPRYRALRFRRHCHNVALQRHHPGSGRQKGGDSAVDPVASMQELKTQVCWRWRGKSKADLRRLLRTCRPSRRARHDAERPVMRALGDRLPDVRASGDPSEARPVNREPVPAGWRIDAVSMSAERMAEWMAAGPSWTC